MKYLDETGTFDTDGFRHACRTFITAQEVIIDLASYPTDRIAFDTMRWIRCPAARMTSAHWTSNDPSPMST